MSPEAHTQLGPDAGGNYEYSWEGTYLAAHFLSDVGRKRDHNEDSCILTAPQNRLLDSSAGKLFAVADGMGGAQAGERASHVALTTLSEHYYQHLQGTIPERLSAAISEANSRIFEEASANPEMHGMGTTVSSLILLGDTAYIGQVGDSRVYISRKGCDLVQITRDHSLVAEQVRSGYITEEEARTHSLKNLITRAVGIKDEVSIDVFRMKLEVGDTLLICSDGLNGLVEDNAIHAAMLKQSLQGAARVLVGRALENGGSDNVTVALVRVTETPPRAAMEDGAEQIFISKPGLLGRLKRFLQR